jgi:2-polyprenyl-3-methyl-5-hydroxy-6-metoxy-1,4-benzoquinol methylase
MKNGLNYFSRLASAAKLKLSQQKIIRNAAIELSLIKYRSKYKMIIEHMEFDLIVSRMFDVTKIRFLDVGAHTGEFLDIFRHSNHRHKYDVVAVEPLQENLQKLRRNAWRFGILRKGGPPI